MHRYLRWALIAFVLFYLFHSPHGAAHLVNRALSGFHHAGTSLSAFVNSIG
jgi:hypothetical protein